MNAQHFKMSQPIPEHQSLKDVPIGQIIPSNQPIRSQAQPPKKLNTIPNSNSGYNRGIQQIYPNKQISIIEKTTGPFMPASSKQRTPVGPNLHENEPIREQNLVHGPSNYLIKSKDMEVRPLEGPTGPTFSPQSERGIISTTPLSIVENEIFYEQIPSRDLHDDFPPIGQIDTTKRPKVFNKESVQLTPNSPQKVEQQISQSEVKNSDDQPIAVQENYLSLANPPIRTQENRANYYIPPNDVTSPVPHRVNDEIVDPYQNFRFERRPDLQNRFQFKNYADQPKDNDDVDVEDFNVLSYFVQKNDAQISSRKSDDGPSQDYGPSSNDRSSRDEMNQHLPKHVRAWQKGLFG